ncbi:lysoplasmalogenase [Paenibacillus sp. NPDC058071]|uniref:lysoplasmalogenase n=1 Tax=Paenibacillus sp. NPDC058071 TaxID=3346326 RepID=UPI0036DEA9F7
MDLLRKYGLPVLILIMSALYIFVVPDEPFAVKLLFKLVPMWLIIAYAWLESPKNRKRSHILLLLGLFFCMLGDGLLVWFVVGLSAFLIGHLFYLSAFLGKWRFTKWRFASVVPIAAYSIVMASYLLPAVKDGGNGALLIPVLLYLIVIALMCWSAIMTGRLWAAVGSVLFVISDSVLAWNKFVSDVPHAGIWIMVTYYAAQLLIARSIRTIDGGDSGVSQPRPIDDSTGLRLS